MQRWRRDMARQREITERIRAEHYLAIEQGRDLAYELPTYLARQVLMLAHNAADLREARAAGWWGEEMRLVAEAHELEATIKLQSWQHSLCLLYGPELGRKLGQHQIEVGMRLEHLVAAYGAPTLAGVAIDPADPTLVSYAFGSPRTGSHFKVRGGVVVEARLGRVSFPEFIYHWEDMGGYR